MTHNGPALAALVPRTAALLILLYQIRLLAADLADTASFVAALAGALASAVFLCRGKVNGRHVRPLEAVIVLALVPWALRAFLALPRLFFPGVSDNTILLDSMLLNLDRNNFSALLPFYWVTFTTYFSQRSRVFLRADIIAADALFLILFSIVPTASISAYRWPVLMIALFAVILFLQIIALILSAPRELKLRGTERTFAGAFVFLLVVLGGILFIRPFQQRAVERGGGLLEPNLFRFDFSQVLRLESEISMNDDLVLIVRKDPEDFHLLLRRYTLSGYSPKQGFSRLQDIDEAAHPQSLPGRRTVLRQIEIDSFRLTEQEYYLVNFDSSAFIGMNMPVEIIPFETWDASSFNSAYAVISSASEALPFELIEAVRGEPGPATLGLSPEEYALYTEYGGDEAIAAFAAEIINANTRRRAPSYWEQVQMIYDRLKYGEYRYSLKPGIAPDGDQLKYFLFTSKKGYCSYYAFAFTLLLRSQGIPSRVAAGFFIDPATEAFNYYPVRSDMAHAWVEVWYPGYGWIEYDPTSQVTAEGEEFRFSQGTPQELFERLMKEILENRSRLRAKEGADEENSGGDLSALGRMTLRFFAKLWPFLAAAGLLILFLALRTGFFWLSVVNRNARKKSLYLWRHAKRRLALAGLGKPADSGEAEWAKTAERRVGGLYSLYQDYAAARFAPLYNATDAKNMAAHYRAFSGEYCKALGAMRRLLAWLLPPLALAIKAPREKKGGSAPNAANIICLFLAIILLFSLHDAGVAQDGQSSQAEAADMLYENAMAAREAENWERAIELLSTGIKSHPLDHRFPWALGNLYYYRHLYRLAWDEYRRAEKITGEDSSGGSQAVGLFYQLANTAAFLNRNDDAAHYLERVLALEPDSRDAIGNLAWIYFKLHRLPEGEKLLLDAMENEDDIDFAMTLGTIYSEMFRYREAKDAYLKAIHGAEAIGDRLFAALSWYNLSIMESRFYQFSLAYDSANASLEAMNRASGRLAAGELYLARMELSRALAEYQAAYGMDSSPLSKLNLAQVFQIGGRLTDAVLYANDCLKAGDDSWMANYGIDPVRYKRDIHEILKDSYRGLLEAEAFFYPANLKETAQSFSRKISYRFRYLVHAHLFRKYSFLSAEAYAAAQSAPTKLAQTVHNIFPFGKRPEGTYKVTRRDEIHLEALNQYFNAFEPYPRRALSYLAQARAFEEAIIPESAPTYGFEEGRLLSNRELLLEALGGFDPLWERDMIARVYAELAALGARAEREDAAERLFSLNPGALLQNGIRLPVELRIDAEIAHAEKFLARAARAAGLEVSRLDSPRYALKFGAGEDGQVSCELYDGGRGITVWRQNMPLTLSNRGTGTRAQRAAFANALREGIFNPF